MSDAILHPASYKDPSGFIFTYQNSIHRQVNQCYAAHYDLLQQSGLYDILIKKNWLIPHREILDNINNRPDWYKTLIPEHIPFISYPYEWSFDMLKDAALLTLGIARKAISFGMILKDATPFNIQFLRGRPVLIDTLSFEKYDEQQPWIAYRQFCECFLFPLYVTHYTGTDAMKLLAIYPDGISADITSRLLPFRSRFNVHVWMHVFLQTRFQREGKSDKQRSIRFSKKKLLLLIDSLSAIIKDLTFNARSNWSRYYSSTISSQQYLHEKEVIFRKLLKRFPFESVTDLGANDGYFSLLASKEGKRVIATDLDSQCINTLYKTARKEKADILPLIIDISHPTPGIGFNNQEHPPFLRRAQTDLLLALALVHHLVIGKNIPLSRLAHLFSSMAKFIIIEFIPKEDEKVLELLKNKKDIYTDYNEKNFVETFCHYYSVISREPIPGSLRVMYAFERK